MVRSSFSEDAQHLYPIADRHRTASTHPIIVMLALLSTAPGSSSKARNGEVLSCVGSINTAYILVVRPALHGCAILRYTTMVMRISRMVCGFLLVRESMQRVSTILLHGQSSMTTEEMPYSPAEG